VSAEITKITVSTIAQKGDLGQNGQNPCVGAHRSRHRCQQEVATMA
jgi:hypothetical protein